MKKLTLISLAVLISASGVLAGWWQTFGGAERDEGTCVQQTSDGGYIVTGVTWSFGRPHESDIWLIKLDSFGHKEWDRTYEAGWGKSVRQTSDGGYIVAGSRIIKADETGDTIWVRSYGGTAQCVQINDEGNYVVVGSKSNDLWIIEIGVDGDSLWSKLLNRTGNEADVGSHITQTQDGGYMVTGAAHDYDAEMEWSKSALLLVKTDENGNEIWRKTYGGIEWDNDLDRGNCVRQTSDGGYIVTGAIHWPNILLKTDENGDSLWISGYGGGEGHCVDQTLDGGYIITGGTESATLVTSPIGGNLWLIKTNDNGDTLWTREYGNGGTDAGRYVQQTTDSGFIAVGYSWSFGAGAEDVYLLKTDSLGLLSISEKPVVEIDRNWEINTSVGRQITLSHWNNPGGVKIEIFDVSGQRIDEINHSSSSGSVTWGDRFPLGVYFFKVTTNQGVTGTAKAVLVR